MISTSETSSTSAGGKRRRSSRRVFLALTIALAATIAFVVVAISTASHSSSTLGQQTSNQLITFTGSHEVAPGTATLKRLGGGTPVVIGRATGKPLIVNFFASWCPACQKELGAIATVAKTSPVRFVGVDTDDPSPGQAMALLKKAGATYPVGVASASLAERYQTGNLPTTAFLNGKGHIVAIALGAVTRPELSRWVRELDAGRPLT